MYMHIYVYIALYLYIYIRVSKPAAVRAAVSKCRSVRTT